MNDGVTFINVFEISADRVDEFVDATPNPALDEVVVALP
jgi:hypothetical protein